MRAAAYLTIWMALALFVLGEAGRAEGDRPIKGTGAVRGLSLFLRRRARTVSAAGLALALLHTVLAFDVFHDWSHADAVRSTAQQTQAVFGVRFGAGLFVNYLFFAVWCLDLILWRPVSPPSPAIWLARGFYLLIIVNGAVVFASDWRRAAGIVIVAALIAAWQKPTPAVRR
jgi:hypothetical protein